MMKPILFLRFLLPFCGMIFLFSCSKENRQETSAKKPEVFTPAAEEIDTLQKDTANSSEIVKETPKPGPKKMPTIAELKTITPNQEAKRALTTDAMKAAEMSLTEFGDFMKSRIPYYRDKGELKFENDIVKIHITNTVMQLQTPKGSLTFPMK